MPSIYRESFGDKRFYNALNDTYKIPNSDEYYEFANPYSEGRPKEHIVNFDDIKPTIKGIVNASGYRIDMFQDFAYDLDDNDKTDEEGNYLHPYFFAKLRKFDGGHGFNLFEHSIDEEEMTVSMTSGSCGACEFVIGVDESTQKNIVQVDESGNLLRDDDGNVKFGEAQDRQNDTINNEVWIALRKDIDTFGVIMPNATSSYKPSVNDTFVILHIDLPKSYILAAEDKLKEELVKYMAMNNSEKFNFSISFSRIFFAENPTILAKLNENARIQLEYDNTTYELYVSSYSYAMSNDKPLPEIRVELSDTLTISQNALQTAISEVKQDVLSSVGSIDALKQGLKYFLRKDVDDRSKGKISSDKGVEVGKYVQGVSGAIIQVDKNTNKTIVEVDNLHVRMKAYFDTLEVVETSSVGGKAILSPAGSVKLIGVEDRDVVTNEIGEVVSQNIWDYYRCYFLAEQDGESVTNKFVNDDQVYSKTFNATNNKYFWRLVVKTNGDTTVDYNGKLCHYVDLSKSDCDANSDAPSVGDIVCHRGNRNDSSRQNFIEFSSVENNAPYITLFQNVGQDKIVGDDGSTTAVDPYSLKDKDIISFGYDSMNGQAYMRVYGDMYIGAKDDSTFIKYTKENGVEIKGKLNVGSKIGEGQTVVEDGIIQSSLVKLGTFVDELTNEEEPKKVFKIFSGTSGEYDESKKGQGIAAWYGGDPIDLFDYYNETSDLFDVPEGVRPAMGLDRMDGTGYRANGSLWWENNGKVHADPLSFFVGEKTVGSLLTAFQIFTKKDGEKEIIDYILPNAPFKSLIINDTLKIGDKVIKQVKENGVGKDIIYIDANLVVRGSVTMYGDSDNYDISSIYDALPIDGQTIYWEAIRDDNGDVIGKVLKAKGGTGGGVADSVAWSNVYGKPTWLLDDKINYSEIDGIPDLSLYQPKITSTNKLAYSLISGTPDLSVYALNKDIPSLNGYATEQWVKDRGYATTDDLDSRINSLIDGAPAAYDTLKEIADVLSGNVNSIGDIITTLGTKWTQDNTKISNWDSAYGWGNHANAGYAKKSDIEGKYVTISGNEDVTGLHDFINGLKIGGIKIHESKNGVIYIEGNIAVKGGVTMYGTDSSSAPSILDSLPVASTSAKGIAQFNSTYFSVSNGVVSIKDGSVGLNESELNEILNGKGYLVSSDLGALAFKSNLLAADIPSLDWSKITSGKSTTLSGYGITDAKINNGVITLGVNSITPLTSVAWGDIVGRPTNLSSFTDDIVKGNYLPLAKNVTSGQWKITPSDGYIRIAREGNTDSELLIGQNSSGHVVMGQQNLTGSTAIKHLTIRNSIGYAQIVSILDTNLQGRVMIDGDSGQAYMVVDKTLSDGKNRMAGLFTSNKSENKGGVAIGVRYNGLKTIYPPDNWSSPSKGANSVSIHGDIVTRTYQTSYSNEYYAWIKYMPNSNTLDIRAITDNQSSDYSTPIQIGDVQINGKSVYHKGNLTKLSQLTDDVVSGNYLPLSGGTINGNLDVTNNLNVGGNLQGGYFGLYSSASNPYLKLTFSGANWYVQVYNNYLYLGNGISKSVRIDSSGNLLTGGGVTMYSQRSLKNVVDERGLSLEELRTIKPTRYTWKDGRDSSIHFGGIADDIQQVLPEVVYKTKEGVLTMDYGNAGFAIASSLIKPVVDHEQRIKALEKENELLKQELNRLRA